MRVYGTLVVEQKTTAPKKVDAAGEILADGSLTLQNGSAKVRANKRLSACLFPGYYYSSG